DAAWSAAQDIGLPVVIKPTDGNHGRGVTLDLKTREDVAAAFEVAERHGSEVLVERFVRGHEHRLLVVGGKVAAAARGETAWVTGDGSSTIVELVDRHINSDPRRGLNEDSPLNRIKADEDGAVLLDLRRQGLTPQSVPEAGRQVLIQRNGNVAIDCTDDVHPEVQYAVCVAGTTDTNLIARLVAWLVHLGGRHVGVSCRDGLFLGNRRVERGNCANWE